jgi:multidrug efflux pump subunit AcrA (membrane-fusion protein)
MVTMTEPSRTTEPIDRDAAIRALEPLLDKVQQQLDDAEAQLRAAQGRFDEIRMIRDGLQAAMRHGYLEDEQP